MFLFFFFFAQGWTEILLLSLLSSWDYNCESLCLALEVHTSAGAGCWWLTPVILVTQEAEIRRIIVQSQPWQIVCKTLF
jgi:hypothetical protein